MTKQSGKRRTTSEATGPKPTPKRRSREQADTATSTAAGGDVAQAGIRQFVRCVDDYLNWQYAKALLESTDRPTLPGSQAGQAMIADIHERQAKLNERRDAVLALCAPLAGELAKAGIDSAPIRLVEHRLGMGGNPDELIAQWPGVKAALMAEADRLRTPGTGDNDRDPFRPISWLVETFGFTYNRVRGVVRNADPPIRRRERAVRGRDKHEYAVRDLANAMPRDQMVILTEIQRIISVGSTGR